MEQHFILCGLGRVGERVLEYLRAAGARVVVIDSHCQPGDARLAGAELVCGDCRRKETLEAAGLARARGVLVLPSDELISLQTALMIRHLHPAIRIVVRMFNQNLINRLGATVANVQTLSVSALAAPVLALVARTGQALSTFRLEDGEPRQIAELTVTPQSNLVQKQLGPEVSNHQAVAIAHLPRGDKPRFVHDVDGSAQLAVGDRVVVCGAPELLQPLLSQGERESLPDLLWAGVTQRAARVVWRTVAMIDLPVKVCTSILLSVILISVLVFHYGMANESLIHAFYRTVSLIATGADMHGDKLDPSAWQLAFISGLRLVGAALIAAFTAIFTNYLIRANLGGALEVRRIPDGGHIIVCGLGNIGYRVVEELLGQGESVVVIERARDNPFIATARRQKVAVIIGDATIREVLQQAKAATARAVVAASSNELVNLEIALLVRELAPKQRVVLRVIEPYLAQTLRQAANIKLALAIPELAAPAFVASLFGDHVRGMMLVAGRMLTVYDLTVRAHDTPFLSKTLGELGAEFHFVPVQWLSKAGPKAVQAQENLAAGDRLTVIIALEDLQRLANWQRDRDVGRPPVEATRNQSPETQ
jgi:Trk K+ transport system NAD-binding subunit